MVTIALSILAVSLFALFFENLGRVLEGGDQTGLAMVYLTSDFSETMRQAVESAVLDTAGVVLVDFVSKDQALERLKKEMAGSTQFLDTLKENPLPHALEIQIQTQGGFEQMAAVVQHIESMELVESVEYGEKWLARFLHLFHLFRMTGYVLGGLFLLIAFFITASTVRLVFHSRQSEVEIMRLVGATDRFIKMPFYITGVIQGGAGGMLGLLTLYAAYLLLGSGASGIMKDLFDVNIGFLSFTTMGGLLVASTFLGWFGCYLSLRQLLK
jgi:cell division transport system permease protein